MEKRRIAFILFVILLISVHGCYTSFTHPPINDPRWGAVQFSDDCAECHDRGRYAPPILPADAEQDDHWRFYSGSAWWQDEYTVGMGVAADPDDRTGPRTVTNTPMTPAPVAMPVQGAVQSLGKKSATDQQNTEEEAAPQRSVGRRTHTSPANDSTAVSKKSSSRSRRD